MATEVVVAPLAARHAPPSRTVEALEALTRATKVLERASGSLSLAHYRVLSAVAAGDARASRVATRLRLGKPAVSASVEALCARGLLVRSAVEADQRAVQLTLTKEGGALLEEARLAMTSALEELMVRTGRREEMIDALVRLNAAIDQAAAERHR